MPQIHVLLTCCTVHSCSDRPALEGCRKILQDKHSFFFVFPAISCLFVSQFPVFTLTLFTSVLYIDSGGPVSTSCMLRFVLPFSFSSLSLSRLFLPLLYVYDHAIEFLMLSILGKLLPRPEGQKWPNPKRVKNRTGIFVNGISNLIGRRG